MVSDRIFPNYFSTRPLALMIEYWSTTPCSNTHSQAASLRASQSSTPKQSKPLFSDVSGALTAGFPIRFHTRRWRHVVIDCGGASPMSPSPPHFGFDIARDLEFRSRFVSVEQRQTRTDMRRIGTPNDLHSAPKLAADRDLITKNSHMF
jgi:hypothetical protein